MLDKQNITGLILAGGAGRRVGHKDKGLISFKGKSLVQRQIEWLKPQVKDIIISANRNIETYESFGYKVINDSPLKQLNDSLETDTMQFNGPLSGLYQGLVHCKTSHLYVHPVDLPFLPSDTVKQVTAYINHLMSDGVVQKRSSSFYLKTNEREHYLSLLIERQLLHRLERTIENKNHRVSQFLKQNKVIGIDLNIPESKFANLNCSIDFL